MRRLSPLVLAGLALASGAAEAQPPPTTTVRLYVLDCGSYPIADLGRFRLERSEVKTSDLSMGCFLVTHPKGSLIWDTGPVPDAAWKPTGAVVTHPIVLPDGQERQARVLMPLLVQLRGVGYSPSDITYLALSHYHFDHTANANEFKDATWLVRRVEWDAMFAEKPPGVTQPSTYASLRNSKTVFIETDEHDVFGDGTVVIKAAPGHTPGHQVLYVYLAETGGVVLSGDLYHYPEARKLQRIPTFDFDGELSRASRARVEAFLKEKGAELWIQHDFEAYARRKKAPEYYQ
jgi:N-acyl homoserine lactone hydrolase